MQNDKASGTTVEGKGIDHIMFIGLGNPGLQYAMTRHNMGALAVAGLAKALSIPLKEEKRFLAKAGKKSMGEATVHVLLPTTYMNQSGASVRKYLDFYKLSPGRCVVVSDDLDLPFGQLRLRSKGSSGGHNGLKSVQEYVGTTEFPRLKIGIGRGQIKEQATSAFVLERFSQDEAEKLPEVIEAAVFALKKLIGSTVEAAMNAVNVKAVEKGPRNEEKTPKDTLMGDKQEEVQ